MISRVKIDGTYLETIDEKGKKLIVNTQNNSEIIKYYSYVIKLVIW